MTVASTAPHTEDVGARAWADLATTALLGTARRPVPVPDTWPGALGQAAGQVTGDATERLLDLAGLLSAYRRSQVHTVPVPAPPAPAPAPSRPLPPAAARARLAEMFRTGSYHHRDEWLEEAARLGYRAPDDLLPELLEMRDWNHSGWSTSRSRTALVEAVLDERGWWLVDQELHSPPRPDVTDLSAWASGKLAAKVSWFATLRDIDPARARELLDAGWSKLAGSARAKLLPVLSMKLGPDDEPLLHRALEDRRDDAHWAARTLLQQLRGTAYVAKMTKLTASWVQVSASPRGDVEIVIRPPAPGAEGLRPGWFGYGNPDGMDYVYWAARMTPPAAWRAWGIPDQIRTLSVRVERPSDAKGIDSPVDKKEPKRRLLEAWVDLGVRERDPDWARSLLGFLSRHRRIWMRMSRATHLLSALPYDERVAFVEQYLAEAMPNIDDDDVAFACEVAGPWPTEYTLLLLRLLADQARTRTYPRLVERLVREHVGQKADVADLPALAAFAETLPADSPLANELPTALDYLTTRRTILEELQ